MSVFPVNRVPDILKRMDLNSSQPEAMKTCFGILAIMSREESNKSLIAQDGMEIILNAMTVHVERTDVQESGCDLLWSLAFNSAAVKEIIAKFGGAVVLVRALKRHSRSADFLKSACGALSNMCQSKTNQEAVSAQGGLQPLVGAIHVHQNNAKLLPFIFDAIASIIVNNEENARTVSSLGIVPVVVAALSRHKACMEVVKSGCHTLAILSDVKGQASKVAFAGGVPIILSLLDAHPLYADLHRVAAVVLLRMLQESSHVGREITCHEGVRILLNSLEKGGAQQDTVAAVTHILYTVTNPTSPAAAAVEAQLWVAGSSASRLGADSSSGSIDATSAAAAIAAAAARKGADSSSSTLGSTALGGVVMILGQYAARRDVVRAACRLINNISGFNNVVAALDRLGILDRVFECVSIHKDTRDVVDSAASLLKIVHRRHAPVVAASTAAAVRGLLHVYCAKMNDEDAVVACMDTIANLVDTTGRIAAEKSRELQELRLLDGKQWEHQALTVCISLLELIMEAEREGTLGTPTSSSSSSSKSSSSNPVNRINWNKGTARVTSSVLGMLESINHSRALVADAAIYRDVLEAMSAFTRIIPPKQSELIKRAERLLHLMDAAPKKSDKMLLSGGRKSLALKPPLPSQSSVNGLNSQQQQQQQQASSNAAEAGSSAHQRSDDSKQDDERDSIDENSVSAKTFAGGFSSSGGDDDSKRQLRKDRSKSWVGTSTSTTEKAAVAAGSFDSSGGGSNSSFQGQLGGAMMSASRPSDQDPRRLLPEHPAKAKKNPKGRYDEFARLLDTWPNYLERLAAPPVNRTFLNNCNGSSALEGSSNPAIPMHMQLVYESSSAAGKGLLSKCPTPVPYMVPVQGLGPPFKHSLSFDSDFESGNLLRAVQKKESEYDLFLRSDLHTPGHTQWFYFAIANAHTPDQLALFDQGVKVPAARVRFHIVNFTKPDSLFNLGMRPVIYSVMDAANKNIGWVRAGSDISYYGNSFMRNNTAGEGLNYYYTLSFTMEFHNPRDTVLIAYSYPFTTSDCRSHVNEILQKPHSADIIRQHKLCQTLSGEDCDLLVITNYRDKDKDRIGPTSVQAVEFNPRDEYGLSKVTSRNKDSNNSGGDSSSSSTTTGGGGSNGFYGGAGRKNQQQQAAVGLKACIFISARVHPGETPASWMMKGMLDFLTSDSAQAKALRQTYVIFIVPMLNPDGVLYGNNRCGLAGVDLNRQWKLPVKGMHPTIYFLKNFMIAQRKLRDVPLYIDLHGHSRKYNVFMYGCDDKKRPKPQVRVLPKFFSMHSIGRKYVCYADCSFNVKKGRESTARVVVCKEINIPCSFTLEATFCGSNYGPLKHCHMNIGHLQETGAALGDTILNYALAEQHVKDTNGIIANVRALTQIQKIIASEGLNGISSYNGPVGYLGDATSAALNTFSGRSESSYYKTNSEKVMDVLKNDSNCDYGDEDLIDPADRDDAGDVGGDEEEEEVDGNSSSSSRNIEHIAEAVDGRNLIESRAIEHNRRIIGGIRAQAETNSGSNGSGGIQQQQQELGDGSSRRRRGSTDEDIQYGTEVVDEDEEDAAADTHSSPPRIISAATVAANSDSNADTGATNRDAAGVGAVEDDGGDKGDVESGSDVSDEDVSDSESLVTSEAVLKGSRGGGEHHHSKALMADLDQYLDPLEQAVRASSGGSMTAASADLEVQSLSGSNSARTARDRPVVTASDRSISGSGGSERLRGKSVSIMNTGRNVIGGGSSSSGAGGIATLDDNFDSGYSNSRKTRTVPDNFLSISSSSKSKSFNKGPNYVGTSLDTSSSYTMYKMDPESGTGNSTSYSNTLSNIITNSTSNNGSNSNGGGGNSGVGGTHRGVGSFSSNRVAAAGAASASGDGSLQNSLTIVSSGSLSSMAIAASGVAGPSSDRGSSNYQSKWRFSTSEVAADGATTGVGIYFGNKTDVTSDSTSRLVSSALAAAADAIGSSTSSANDVAAMESSTATTFSRSSGIVVSQTAQIQRAASVEQLAELSADLPASDTLFSKTVKKSGTKKKKAAGGGRSGADSSGKSKTGSSRRKSSSKATADLKLQQSQQQVCVFARGGDSASISVSNANENDSDDDFEILDSPRATAAAVAGSGFHSSAVVAAVVGGTQMELRDS